MRLLILGATGGLGQHLVTGALEAGHEVTALARNSANVTLHHPRLNQVAGSVPDDRALLARVSQGQDVVISALGRGTSLKSTDLIQRSVPVILSAMQAHGVRRLIFTSAIGVGRTIEVAPLFSRMMIRLLLSDIYADKAAGEALIRRSDLDWTLVQPAQLTNGRLTGKYRAGEHLALEGIPRISRADVAHFMLGQIANTAYVRKTVVLGY